MPDRYDLVIGGGTLIDPAQGIHAPKDIGIIDGRIAEVADSLAAADSAEHIDATGKLVVPGLIDLHVHAFDGVGPWGIDADRFCLARGTTTALDTGTAGGPMMDGFRKLVIDRARTRILALVHIAGTGLINGGPHCEGDGELENLAFCNVDWAVDAHKRHPGVSLGLKIRLTRSLAADGKNEREALRRVREAADRAETRIMVHSPQSSLRMEEILESLRPGDILTHCLHGHPCGIVDDKKNILDAARAARRRGIVFDVGHGVGSFSWDVAEAAARQDFMPDVISTDIHAYNVDGPVWDMPTCMTKILHLGLELDDVIEKSTWAPARAMNLDSEIGSLKPGTCADATLLTLEEGTWDLPDSLGQVRTVERRLKLQGVVRAGATVEIEREVGF